MTNPIRHSFDGRVGGVLEKRYFLRNDDANTAFSGIQLYPVDLGGDHLTDGTNGFAWKLKAGDQQPLDQEWATIAPANTIMFSGIGDGTIGGDISTYLPFWLRIEVPKGANVSSYDDVVLRTTASGIAV